VQRLLLKDGFENRFELSSMPHVDGIITPMNTQKFSGALIKKKGKVLLVRERHSEARGLWSFPLGHVEERETLVKAAEREAGEETGFVVSVTKKVKTKTIFASEFKSSHKFSKGKIQLTIFKGKIGNGRYEKAELKHRWFAIKEIGVVKLRGSWMKAFL
jgi:8-oxo-dGTP pyrophosphatase MutT (NUDIX family)